MRQLGLERVTVVLGGEVAALTTPVGDRARDARDHLLDRALAGRRRELSAEVLLGHDVGGVLRPRLRELDVLLAEGADRGRPRLPLDGVEGVDARPCEQPPHGQGLGRPSRALKRCMRRDLLHRLLLPSACRPPARTSNLRAVDYAPRLGRNGGPELVAGERIYPAKQCLMPTGHCRPRQAPAGCGRPHPRCFSAAELEPVREVGPGAARAEQRLAPGVFHARRAVPEGGRGERRRAQ